MSDEADVLVVHAQRRGIELVMCLLAGGIGIAGVLITSLNRDGVLPSNWLPVSLLWLGLCVAAHLVVRWQAPYADPVLLPSVLLLNGLGLAMINRLDIYANTTNASTQLLWTFVALAAFTATLVVLRDHRVLQGFPYLLFLAGMGLLLLPLVPGLGAEINGSRIWIRVAGYSFQPAEIAKIVLTFAFASYLSERRDVLQLAGRRIGPIALPRLRDLVPVLIMWAASIVVLVFQNDLGTSLLFFGLFVMMLYVSTEQVGWVLGALVAFAGAAAVIYTQASHVARRVESWLDPFADVARNGQIIEGQFGMAWGGLAGRGWGLGSPGRIPLANSDFIAAAIGEELGLMGLSAVIMLYGIVVSRGLRTALSTRDDFGKLLAAGLSFTFALQVLAIIGGVTRLLPLTGLTTPFMSQGGSSLLANWVIVAILLRVSHTARRPPLAAPPAPILDLGDEPTALIGVRPGVRA